MTERDPIVLAKEVASLDRLSGGRFLFGVGAGWNRTEMANHGTDPRTRMALLADIAEFGGGSPRCGSGPRTWAAAGFR